MQCTAHKAFLMTEFKSNDQAFSGPLVANEQHYSPSSDNYTPQSDDISANKALQIESFVKTFVQKLRCDLHFRSALCVLGRKRCSVGREPRDNIAQERSQDTKKSRGIG